MYGAAGLILLAIFGLLAWQYGVFDHTVDMDSILVQVSCTSLQTQTSCTALPVPDNIDREAWGLKETTKCGIELPESACADGMVDDLVNATCVLENEDTQGDKKVRVYSCERDD